MSQDEKDWDWYTSPSGERIRRVWSSVVNGTLPLSELDDTEVSEMRLKASDGRFGGPKPNIDHKLFVMFKREILHRYELKMAKLLLPKISDTMVAIMDSPTATDGEKFRASQYLTERVIGKIPDKMEISAEVRPWEGTVAGILTDITDDGEGAED